MKFSLTIAFITSRPEPKFKWFLNSLVNQLHQFAVEPAVIVVDLFAETRQTQYGDDFSHYPLPFCHRVSPKPNVWQGEHRLTKDNWWAKSNALNTAICLCKSEWFAAVDDRCVLTPEWLGCIRRAMDGNCAICGSYEKRIGMNIESGSIMESGMLSGEDGRLNYLNSPRVFDCPGNWFYGCTWAMPLEWLLSINGADERCDSLGMEDIIMGCQLKNAGYALKYDPRMKIIEDRTPSELGEPMKRSSKERFPSDPLDKGHKALEIFARENRANHHCNVRELRDKILAGGEWPGIETCPTTDWFDGMKIREFDNL